MSKSVAQGFDARGALRAALRAVQVDSGLPVAFGAFVEDGSTAVLSEFRGTRTKNLHSLEIRTGSGLGGRVIAESRPVAVNDYRTADSITHEYDPWVLAEGLASLAAAPVMVRDRLAGLIYVATRERNALGDRSKSAILGAGRRLSVELTIQDEVRRRLSDAEVVATAAPEHVGDVASLEEIRALHAELRVVAQMVGDAGLSQRITDVSRRLAHVGRGSSTASRAAVRLSPREVDVLAQIALGCTNQEAATRLSIKPETTKAYLRGAMRKLGAHTRFEAVVKARALRVIP
ncbi:MAG: LuxR C-terminal-related transcriptional regulator [Pseudonocardiales bacterium]|nr:LuxR C-terminal-related transcriptional regulator [Pseudonocardiales bacterium]